MFPRRNLYHLAHLIIMVTLQALAPRISPQILQCCKTVVHLVARERALEGKKLFKINNKLMGQQGANLYQVSNH
jgi:hypothetical protein